METLSMKDKVKDKALLVFSGLLVVLVLLGTLIITENNYGMSKDWSLFLLFSVGYIAMVINGCKTDLMAKKHRFRSFLVVILTMIGCIASWALLFHTNMMPFPKRNIWTWGIGTTAFAYISIVAYIAILRKADRRT